MNTRLLVTGAGGFVGGALCRHLIAAGYTMRGTRRSADADVEGSTSVEWVVVPDINADVRWDEALRDVDAVVHLAARVHVMRDEASDPLAAFRRVNTQGTEALARAAARCGVRRFIFLSSIKVNGEETAPPLPSPLPRGERGHFSEIDTPDPQDPYAISKWEAEQVLTRIAVAQQTLSPTLSRSAGEGVNSGAGAAGMEVVILRCPLVYGPGVKGNFLRLLRAVDCGIPLPLASANNQRSLIYLGNLVSAITACIEHPAAAGKTYLLSDGEDVSTAQLIQQMAQALGKPSRLWPCPVGLIELAGRLAGKSDEVSRLLGSLCIDSSKIRRELGWTPPYTLAQGLTETAAWYRENK